MSNFMPSPYAPKSARQVDAVAPGYIYIVGPDSRPSRGCRAPQYFAEERLDGRTLVRRRFPSEEAALAQAGRWATFRRCQLESPL